MKRRLKASLTNAMFSRRALQALYDKSLAREAPAKAMAEATARLRRKAHPSGTSWLTSRAMPHRFCATQPVETRQPTADLCRFFVREPIMDRLLAPFGIGGRGYRWAVAGHLESRLLRFDLSLLMLPHRSMNVLLLLSQAHRSCNSHTCDSLSFLLSGPYIGGPGCCLPLVYFWDD